MASFSYSEVAEAAGLAKDETRNVISYLTNKGLLEWDTLEWLSMTTWGIDEVEQLLADPESPTANLPAPASINVIHVQEQYGVMQVQQATTASVQHATSFGAQELAGLSDVIREYRRILELGALTGDDKAEAEAELATVESQLSSSRPKRTIVMESLRTLRSLAENVAAGVGTQALLHQFGMFGL